MSFKSLFGTELPIIQAPMAGVQGAALAAAVSNAGGLGSLPTAMLSLNALHKELTTLRSMTDRPYNVNFFCHKEPVPDKERDMAWMKALSPYYAEFGIDLNNIPEGTSRQPFSAEAANVLEEFCPAVISFHFGLPSEALLERVKGWGAKVISSATSINEALWLEKRGVDAVIAQGYEAGGHRGHFLSDDLSLQMGTLALVSQIANAVQVPVIAAGGIADSRGVTAAMKLGAVGVQVGTAFLLCPEAATSALHRAAIKSTGAQHTALSNLFSGRPARGIVNRLMRELGPLNEVAPAFPTASTALAPLRAEAEKQGLVDFTPLWAGQNVTGCKEVSAAILTRELAEGLV